MSTPTVVIGTVNPCAISIDRKGHITTTLETAPVETPERRVHRKWLAYENARYDMEEKLRKYEDALSEIESWSSKVDRLQNEVTSLHARTQAKQLEMLHAWREQCKDDIIRETKRGV